MSKEVKKAEKKNNKIKKQNIDIKKILNKILDIIKKYYYILILALPFILIDLFTKILGYKIHFYGIMKLVPILFTLSWIFFVLGASLFYKKKIGKTIYIIFFILSFAIYTVNNIYYSMTGTFFDFSMVLLAGEGSEYFLDAIKDCNIWVYILMVPIIGSFILGLKFYPSRNKTNLKNVILERRLIFENFNFNKRTAGEWKVYGD